MNKIKPAPVGAQTAAIPPSPPMGEGPGVRAGGEGNDWSAVAGISVPVSVVIPCDLVDPNPEQPRVDFPEAELKELGASILEVGLIQPIVVHPNGDRFTLHDGERRLRASKLVGLAEIAAYIVPPGMDAKQLLLRAIVANDQRADLSPIERARGYQKLADEYGLSDSQIATQIGKSRSVVANTRRLLGLPPEQQNQVVKGELNERQALALLPFYQLPEPAREKLLNTWQGKELAKPEKLTSDDIRQRFNDAISMTGSQIKIIDPAIPYTGDGIYHSTCADCDCCITKKAKERQDDVRCINSSCLKIKQNIVKRASLEQAKATLSLDYLDPDVEYKWDQVGGFYGSDGKMALQVAQEKQCPNLRLKYSDYTSDAISGIPNVGYCCLYPGNSKKCACAKAVEIKEKQAEQAKKKAIKQAKDQAASRLAEFFRLIPLPCLRTLLYSEYQYDTGKRNKVLEMTQEKLASELAAALIGQNVRFSEYVPIETSQKELEDWLAKMGFNFDPIPDLDRRLARIAEWIRSLRNEVPFPVQVTGNLSNLAELANEAQQLQDAGSDQDRAQLAERKILSTVDNFKSILLALQPIVETQAVEIEHVSWLLTVPSGDDNFQGHLKAVNQTTTLDYTLCLFPLFTQGKTAREAIERRLRKLEAPPTEMLAEMARIKTRLGEITTWISKPDNHTNQKLLNRGQATADLAYDVNSLVRRHGQRDELTALLAEVEAAEKQCEVLRRALAGSAAPAEETVEDYRTEAALEEVAA